MWESIVVIWNSGTAEAEDSSAKLQSWQASNWDSPVVIEEHVESRKGIPYARNAALDIAAHKGLNWFVFIDDDCVAHDGWLYQLTDMANKSQADVVAGGWTIKSDGERSTWLPDGVFGTKTYLINGREAVNGDILPTAYTRNVLVRTPVLSLPTNGGVRFDESLANQGGSDVIFFSELSQAGARIIFAEHAVVDEIYRGHRLSLSWNLKRRIRNTQLALSRAQSTGEKIAHRGQVNFRELRLLFRVPASILLVPASIFSARVRRFIGTTLLHSAPYIGALLHVLRISYEDYSDRFVFRRLPNRQ